MTFGKYTTSLIDGVPHAVYIFLLAFFCIASLILLSFYGIKKGWRYILAFLLVEYVILIYSSTVFFRETQIKRSFNYIPFWSYERSDLYVENIMNIIFFIPIGFILGTIIRIKASHRYWIIAVLLGSCLSLGIEMLQLLFMKGFSETDDIIHNTTGCILGYGLSILVNHGYERLICYRNKRSKHYII